MDPKTRNQDNPVVRSGRQDDADDRCGAAIRDRDGVAQRKIGSPTERWEYTNNGPRRAVDSARDGRREADSRDETKDEAPPTIARMARRQTR